MEVRKIDKDEFDCFVKRVKIVIVSTWLIVPIPC